MKKAIVQVKQEHIDRGVPRSKRRLPQERCAVELAAGEQLALAARPGHYVLPIHIDVSDIHGCQFVIDFDEGKMVVPCSVQILIPDEGEEIEISRFNWR